MKNSYPILIGEQKKDKANLFDATANRQKG